MPNWCTEPDTECEGDASLFWTESSVFCKTSYHTWLLLSLVLAIQVSASQLALLEVTMRRLDRQDAWILNSLGGTGENVYLVKPSPSCVELAGVSADLRVLSQWACKCPGNVPEGMSGRWLYDIVHQGSANASSFGLAYMASQWMRKTSQCQI